MQHNSACTQMTTNEMRNRNRTHNSYIVKFFLFPSNKRQHPWQVPSTIDQILYCPQHKQFFTFDADLFCSACLFNSHSIHLCVLKDRTTPFDKGRMLGVSSKASTEQSLHARQVSQTFSHFENSTKLFFNKIIHYVCSGKSGCYLDGRLPPSRLEQGLLHLVQIELVTVEIRSQQDSVHFLK